MLAVGTEVGNISENDIHLAVGENTVIYGFNVDLPPAVKLGLAPCMEVNFKVIYELLMTLYSMEALLAPEIAETEIGELEIAGCI